MKSPFYRVFVGHFEKNTDAKSTLAKLRECGLLPSVFKLDDGYSIQIAAFLKKEDAEHLLVKLINRGFDAFINEPEK